MTKAERRAFDAGFASGKVAGRAEARRAFTTEPTHHQSNGVDGERPKLHLVPVDAPTAELIEFPTNEKTAS